MGAQGLVPLAGVRADRYLRVRRTGPICLHGVTPERAASAPGLGCSAAKLSSREPSPPRCSGSTSCGGAAAPALCRVPGASAAPAPPPAGIRGSSVWGGSADTPRSRSPPTPCAGTHLLPAGGSHAPCCRGGAAARVAPAGPGAALPPPVPHCTGRRAAACAPRPCPPAAAAPDGAAPPAPATAPGRSHLPRLRAGRSALLPGRLVAAARPSEPAARRPAPGTGSPSPGTAPSGLTRPSRPSEPTGWSPQRRSYRRAGETHTPAEAKFASARCSLRRRRVRRGCAGNHRRGFPLVLGGVEQKNPENNEEKNAWCGGQRPGVTRLSGPVLAAKVFTARCAGWFLARGGGVALRAAGCPIPAPSGAGAARVSFCGGAGEGERAPALG